MRVKLVIITATFTEIGAGFKVEQQNTLSMCQNNPLSMKIYQAGMNSYQCSINSYLVGPDKK